MPGRQGRRPLPGRAREARAKEWGCALPPLWWAVGETGLVKGECAPCGSRPGCPLLRARLPPSHLCSCLLPAGLTFRWWLPRVPGPSDSCRSSRPGDESSSFPGARGRRKLARLRVGKRPRRRREAGALHLLQQKQPGLAWPGLPLARHRRTKRTRAGLAKAELSSEAGRTERSKRMRLYSRKGNYKKVHVHGSHPHDRQRPMEGPNNS